MRSDSDATRRHLILLALAATAVAEPLISRRAQALHTGSAQVTAAPQPAFDCEVEAARYRRFCRIAWGPHAVTRQLIVPTAPRDLADTIRAHLVGEGRNPALTPRLRLDVSWTATGRCWRGAATDARIEVRAGGVPLVRLPPGQHVVDVPLTGPSGQPLWRVSTQADVATIAVDIAVRATGTGSEPERSPAPIPLECGIWITAPTIGYAPEYVAHSLERTGALWDALRVGAGDAAAAPPPLQAVLRLFVRSWLATVVALEDDGWDGAAESPLAAGGAATLGHEGIIAFVGALQGSVMQGLAAELDTVARAGWPALVAWAAAEDDEGGGDGPGARVDPLAAEPGEAALSPLATALVTLEAELVALTAVAAAIDPAATTPL